MRSRANFRAYLLIVVGSCFLLSKLGWLPDPVSLIFQWWPVILILLGMSMLLRRSSRDET
jgi:hypothetical protein